MNVKLMKICVVKERSNSDHTESTAHKTIVSELGLKNVTYDSGMREWRKADMCLKMSFDYQER